MGSSATKIRDDLNQALSAERISVAGPLTPEQAELLTPESLRFVAGLVRKFEPTRRQLLERRKVRQREIDGGQLPDFLPETRDVRAADWRVASIPSDLRDRRVEITGPVDRKMIINALNSGASVFMADFEDSNTPTWENNVQGQVNLKAAVRGTLAFRTPEGKDYKLNARVATLMVRPRGWHLPEKHVLVDGAPISGSLFDFGLFFFHNAAALVAKGSGPYFYLPKMESHLEARLWNDVFNEAQDRLSLPRGTIRATVLIETILAGFEMDEILVELKDHSAGLNCGRWDYIFSFIKKFRERSDFVLPDRAQVRMDRAFLKAYVDLLIRTCHRRGIHAMGGMAAQIPIKTDPAANEAALGKVREDKLREVKAGHDGTWVAHPGLVPVAKAIFDAHMPGPNQIGGESRSAEVSSKLDRSNLGDASNSGGAMHAAGANSGRRADAAGDRPETIAPGGASAPRGEAERRAARELLAIPEGTITENGLRVNINVGIQYLEAWLRGTGCVPLYNLMEDAATAEISRSQVWQWIRHEAKLEDGRTVTRALVVQTIAEELEKIRHAIGAAAYDAGRFETASRMFERMMTSEEFTEFMTLVAYEEID